MTERKYKLGDVVQLKSGSARMTVTQLFDVKPRDGSDGPSCRCTFFHEGKFSDAILTEAALELGTGEAT